ncbi:unnamed protein product [Rhizophagus irregularis]|uniref:Yeast cell wall synthesis Kre9/Knh1-like N-terminal domain-containing protein n=1 Tax=Rhizophagus irregularis TaxID=588596 RepID=A0A2N1NFU4_9GLOM|nr:hypothetical protein RhiirC2_742195 [Rhizophagus irregularis]CAB4391791.1 unnamed protein product [Rhizophagus irregularis]CAB5383045.1 unnamed protein product [Rhizophagus irregularis]
MKFSTILLGVALYMLSPVSAGITTNTPFASVTWEGGDDEDIIWADDGKAPKLADLGITTIDLMMGNSTVQVFVANIAKVPATAKQVEYHVPETIGPISNNYFIKYTAGTYTSYSGSFRIEDVYGQAPIAASPAPPTDPAAPPKITDPNTPPVTGDPKAVVPAPNPIAAPSAPPAGTPKSTIPSPVAGPTPSTAQNNLPTPISSDASNLFPSFSGVAAAAVAFAFTYLY